MALVLRKVLLPKNVSLLKNIRKHGRTLTNTSDRNCAAAISNTSSQGKDGKQAADEEATQDLTLKMDPTLNSLQMSPAGHAQETVPRPWWGCYNPAECYSSNNACLHNPLSYICHSATTLPASFADINANVNACCACNCPCPCANCCGQCLPPPCDTPPKCLQYMTGYYYYPYGTWFCGPYHVKGLCCCGGPVKPGCCGACGPTVCMVPDVGSMGSMGSAMGSMGSAMGSMGSMGSCGAFGSCMSALVPAMTNSTFCLPSGHYSCGGAVAQASKLAEPAESSVKIVEIPSS